RYLTDRNVSLKPRYQFDTIDAATRMIGAGLAWGFLPALGILHGLQRGEAIRAANLAKEPIKRTIWMALRRGEPSHIAEQIHKACVDALKREYLPVVGRMLPTAKGHIEVHADARYR